MRQAIRVGAKEKRLKIYKYVLKITDTQTVRMPVGAHLMSVGNQSENLVMWAMVDPTIAFEERTIHVRGTGHDADGLGSQFLGTALFAGGGLVWHVWGD